METPSFRPAEATDARNVTELVNAAYGHYVERIGRPPAPFTEDYAEVIRNHRVTVAESQGAIVGVIVLASRVHALQRLRGERFARPFGLTIERIALSLAAGLRPGRVCLFQFLTGP